MFLTRLGLRLQDGRHRRRHPGRPARRHPSGPARGPGHPRRRRRRPLRRADLRTTSSGTGWSAPSSTPTAGATQQTSRRRRRRPARPRRAPAPAAKAVRTAREHRGPQRDRHARSTRCELVACARYVLEAMRVHPQADLCLMLVDEAAMEELHVQWMDLPGPTDVLSFPMDELRPGRDGQEPEEGVLGDIVLCPPVAARQAARGRSRHRGGAAAAHHARHPAPARLRPRRAGRGARDVRAAAHSCCSPSSPAAAARPADRGGRRAMIVQLVARRARQRRWSRSCSPRPRPRSSRMSRVRAAELVDEGRPRRDALAARSSATRRPYLSVPRSCGSSPRRPRRS